MYPILDRYGPFFLYSFNAMLVLGALASLALTAWLANQRRVHDWLDGLLTAAAVALVGGRVGYVLAHASYFREHPAEAWQLWRGGLSYHGALLAGLVALWVWSRLQRKTFLLYAGLFAPGLALLSAAGWAACWLEGCAYGLETTSGLLAAYLPDEFGVLAVRYQTQLIGFVLSLALFVLLMWLWHRWTAGALFWFALLSLSLVHGLVGLMRGDPVPLFLGWRVDVWLDSGIALFALLCFWIAKRAKYKTSKI
jgi:phosphatidylglycerol:prolipoprotein diacylglycerol transferase